MSPSGSTASVLTSRRMFMCAVAGEACELFPFGAGAVWVDDRGDVDPEAAILQARAESDQNRHPPAPHLAIVTPAAAVLAVGLHAVVDPPLDNVGQAFQSLALVNRPLRRIRNRFVTLVRSGRMAQIHPDDLVLGKHLGIFLEETARRCEEFAFPVRDIPDAPEIPSMESEGHSALSESELGESNFDEN